MLQQLELETIISSFKRAHIWDHLHKRHTHTHTYEEEATDQRRQQHSDGRAVLACEVKYAASVQIQIQCLYWTATLLIISYQLWMTVSSEASQSNTTKRCLEDGLNHPAQSDSDLLYYWSQPINYWYWWSSGMWKDKTWRRIPPSIHSCSRIIPLSYNLGLIFIIVAIISVGMDKDMLTVYSPNIWEHGDNQTGCKQAALTTLSKPLVLAHDHLQPKKPQNY